MSAFKNAMGIPQPPTADPGRLSAHHNLQMAGLPASSFGNLDFSKPGVYDQLPDIDLRALSPQQAPTAPPQQAAAPTPLDELQNQLRSIQGRHAAGSYGPFPIEDVYRAQIPNYDRRLGRREPGSDV